MNKYLNKYIVILITLVMASPAIISGMDLENENRWIKLWLMQQAIAAQRPPQQQYQQPMYQQPGYQAYQPYRHYQQQQEPAYQYQQPMHQQHLPYRQYQQPEQAANQYQQFQYQNNQQPITKPVLAIEKQKVSETSETKQQHQAFQIHELAQKLANQDKQVIIILGAKPDDEHWDEQFSAQKQFGINQDKIKVGIRSNLPTFYLAEEYHIYPFTKKYEKQYNIATFDVKPAEARSHNKFHFEGDFTNSDNLKALEPLKGKVHMFIEDASVPRIDAKACYDLLAPDGKMIVYAIGGQGSWLMNFDNTDIGINKLLSEKNIEQKITDLKNIGYRQVIYHEAAIPEDEYPMPHPFSERIDDQYRKMLTPWIEAIK